MSQRMTSRTIRQLVPSQASWIRMTSMIALCALGCAEEGQAEGEYSGKKKIAYAPYQDAQIVHKSPVSVRGDVAASQEQIARVPGELANAVINSAQPSTFTAPKIVESAQTSGAHAAQSMIAAGYPSGPQGAKKAKPTPSSAPAVRAPSSAPAARRAPGHPSSAPQQPVAVANYVYGEISLDPTLVGSVKPGSVLFVVVRRHVEGGKGMLIAATKQANINKDSFPLQYVVKQKDAMMGAPLVGKITVSARVDQDGDAISKQPGDLVTELSAPVMVGENPVKLTLNKAL